MSKSIQDYLPERTDYETVMVQGRVSTQIVNEVKKIMKQDNLAWTDILTACLRHFLDEMSPAKKK